MTEERRARNQAMAEAYRAGRTYQQIAHRHGISKGRARQIILRVERLQMIEQQFEIEASQPRQSGVE